jgi:hypothetical protein
MNIARYPTLNGWLVLWLAFLLNFVTQAAHEAGHWAVYQLGGHGPTWGLTRLVQTDQMPRQPDEWVTLTYPDGDVGWLRLQSNVTGQVEQVMAAAGGPLASLLVAGLSLAFSSTPLEGIGIGAGADRILCDGRLLPAQPDAHRRR